MLDGQYSQEQLRNCPVGYDRENPRIQEPKLLRVRLNKNLTYKGTWIILLNLYGNENMKYELNAF